MKLTRYGVEVPDIGCTIVQTGTRVTSSGVEQPTFDIQPNDPDAYRRLIEMIEADVGGPNQAVAE